MTEAEKAYQYFVIAVPENEEQAKAYFWARKALQPTLTPPNEGAKDKNVPANEPLTLEELKAEAKRQGYKLIKAKRPRFERCLCGHNVHQWVSGPKGWAVYCKHCGLYGPWAKKSHNAVIVAWNTMILEKRMEQSHEDV